MTLKQLAIDSLGIYSSACRYFITLAPVAVHADTMQRCDEATYARRGWCRLEQWAHATSGFDNMFVFGEKRKLELSGEAETMKDALFVFEGDFSVSADKLKIVDTVLGMWSLVLAHKGDLLERVNAERGRTFPAEYFGGLADLLEEDPDDELEELARGQGEATVHPSNLLHAVTAMQSGVRYSAILFFHHDVQVADGSDSKK